MVVLAVLGDYCGLDDGGDGGVLVDGEEGGVGVEYECGEDHGAD